MSSQKYTLQEVTSSSLMREFLDLPKRIYKDCKEWVCPLDNDIESVFDRKKNDLYADGDSILWIARDKKGEVVGRIAAFYNNELAAKNEQPTGSCGFFEAIDDQELANLLFDSSRDWLKAHGMEAMDGPVNFGSRDSWWGLLVEGYDHEPLYGNNYHLPYYKALFENYGFQNYFNQHSYIWLVDNDDVNARVHDRAKRIYETPGYHFDHAHMDRLDKMAEDLRTIYNRAWSMFEGVKPMEEAEVQQMVATLKPILDPEVVYFAYFNDEPIGFFVMIPDLNRIIGRFNGKFHLWNKLRLIWNLKVRRSCDRMFGLIFGIDPAYQGKGVESGIMRYILETYIRTPRCRYKQIEFAWIGDFNPVMNRMMESYVGASKFKMHTTYRYLFDREKPFTRCPRLGLKRREKSQE